MRLREQYKHLLNYGANLITLLVEGVCFGYIWYSVYEEQFGFWRRGNWAVVGLYVLVIFFFTKVFGEYRLYADDGYCIVPYFIHFTERDRRISGTVSDLP